MINYKKGQIGSTLTWIVATIIVVVILGIFIYASDILAEGKGVDTSSVSPLDEKTGDLFAAKSLSAYLISNADKGNVFKQIKEDGIDVPNGELSKLIFFFLYPFPSGKNDPFSSGGDSENHKPINRQDFAPFFIHFLHHQYLPPRLVYFL